MVQIRYGIIEDPSEIFGAVGRCGSGYNTLWADWSVEGRAAYNSINREYQERMDEACGHYKNVEESILELGFLNPLIVTCGKPLQLKLANIPPEIRALPLEKQLYLEGTSGGSRLWVAQKHNLPVPCIINDQVGRFKHFESIASVTHAKTKFADSSAALTVTAKGLAMAGNLHHSHLDDEWDDVNHLNSVRVPLWVEIMKKHGYAVEVRPHLRKFVEHLL